MDKKILASLMMIGIVAAVLGGATYAVFSDTEKSVDNTMTAGTIDFAVDGQNPWDSITWSKDLGDMKPCVVHYGEINITNVGVNPMKLWKRINITDQDGGTLTEPECVEGGGVYANGACTDGYDERCNLASYTLYDMNVTIGDGEETTIIDHANQVRLDNVNGVWIYLGELPAGQSMIVNQSYHLSSWAGASEPTVTNWAQGDRMTFDVELYGEQITGPGPNLDVMMVVLNNKDANWDPILDDRVGTLFYSTSGPGFEYDFSGIGLNSTTDYSLIYYADPWPGNYPGAFIASGTTNDQGALNLVGSIDLGMDLPTSPDLNYPVGAKIWLVLSSDYDASTNVVTPWNPGEYLFEENLISYEDTDD